MKVLIVDDEKLARDRIKRFISELDFKFSVFEAASGLKALQKITDVQPDLVFLDIQMPGLTGLELLQQIEQRPFRVVFQTAYDEYAIKAFEEQACDYLLKPFTLERFKVSVEKALQDIQRGQRLEELERQFRARDGYLQRLSIKVGDKYRVVNLDEVVCFISRDHYTCVHTADSEFITEVSLTHLEQRLDPEKFLRCHRQGIVNLSKIRTVIGGPNMQAELDNGLLVPVARQRRKDLNRVMA